MNKKIADGFIVSPTLGFTYLSQSDCAKKIVDCYQRSTVSEGLIWNLYFVGINYGPTIQGRHFVELIRIKRCRQ